MGRSLIVSLPNPARLVVLVRNEFARRGNDTHFLMWVAFLLTFASTRLYVLLISHNLPQLSASFSVGEHVIVGGYHIHHITVGVLMVVAAGFVTLHYAGRRLNRLAAVLYGAGLAFIVDEIGFIVGGITPYQNDYEVFFLVVFISSLFMVGIYWPQFYRRLEWPVKLAWRLARRKQERRGQRSNPRAPAMPAPVAADSGPDSGDSGADQGRP